MRTPVVAGNWKMNKTVAETRELLSALIPGLQAVEGVEKIVAPPCTALLAAREMLKGTGIGLSAQNMHWEEHGAFTGEVAPGMVAELCQYVIIGHSERRAYFGETDATVNKKVAAALGHGLIPIVCVGETLEQNQAGETAAVVSRQVAQGLEGIALEDPAGLMIAYEPVWAIGTGLACDPDAAQSVVADVIRPALEALWGAETAQGVRVLYGGSVKPGNAAPFFAKPDIDGALVGGASLKADAFLAIAQAAV
ncbi:MAG TPA: triose-phosphate isomerase [Chloroflexi bacterium]|nr:triose-phosphate isomerase [Chloroflexota bacterium]